MRPGLEEWRRNVGGLVSLDLGSRSSENSAPRSLVVLSWNVWIGHGRLQELVTRIRSGDYAGVGADPDLPLVVLLQEAYRSDSSIPPLGEGRSGRVLRSEEHTSELQSQSNLVCRLLLEKKK